MPRFQIKHYEFGPDGNAVKIGDFEAYDPDMKAAIKTAVRVLKEIGWTGDKNCLPFAGHPLETARLVFFLAEFPGNSDGYVTVTNLDFVEGA